MPGIALLASTGAEPQSDDPAAQLAAVRRLGQLIYRDTAVAAPPRSRTTNLLRRHNS